MINSPTLILTRGLPASGKTTWAKKQAQDNPRVHIICKDDIREMLGNTIINEGRIIEIRNDATRRFLAIKHSVIWADTNLNPIHVETGKKLAEEYNAFFQIQEFPTTVEECLRRDSLREKPVGAKAIYQMYYQYVAKRYVPKQNHLLPKCVIVDMDGTLARFEGIRGPYEAERCFEDAVFSELADLLRALDDNVKIIIVSGREDKHKQLTESWCIEKAEVIPDKIFMRTTGDMQPDDSVKEQIYVDNILDKYNVIMVFDDRPRVIRMWRKWNLPVANMGLGYEF